MAAEHDAEERNAVAKVEQAKATLDRSVEAAVVKRQRAQILMANADLAMYKATMALRIAEAARVVEPSNAAADFLD